MARRATPQFAGAAWGQYRLVNAPCAKVPLGVIIRCDSTASPGVIMVVLLIAALIAAPNPASLDAPRRAYAQCLKKFETDKLAAKTSADDYAAAIKAACAAGAEALSNALVKYDVAMGTKRTAAVENAKLDLEDYQARSESRYRDIVTH